ncbi:DNA cytosine methyltransferase [Trinickia sp. NRRL B-1857]|uniref:DNA cytosine methyltransferase n=1 Tax=Trinickia sp. NRRL B-1857 TaxID=3162879 RepID=UPI003D2B1B1A
MAGAYYNELDEYCARWLRNLIAAGHIAPGDVDERDIRDVHPDDLRGYTQCHFFAGIGVWSAALRRAGWPDDRPVWTGSCPCQPFSAAGKGLGFADERHLWPSWHWLIGECRPPVIFGEQVASAAVDVWVDLVQADVEGLDYAYGCVPFPSASVDAPHIRDRNFWMAHANERAGRQGRTHLRGRLDRGDAQSRAGLGGGGVPGWLAHDHDHGRAAQAVVRLHDGQYFAQSRGGVGGLDDAQRERFDSLRAGHYGGHDRQFFGAAREGSARPGATNGFWRAADWLLCRDGKWRPVEPGTFPLAHGTPARVGRLRAYGNAINLEQAAEFISAAREAIEVAA